MDNHGYTPLHWACFNGMYKSMKNANLLINQRSSQLMWLPGFLFATVYVVYITAMVSKLCFSAVAQICELRIVV